MHELALFAGAGGGILGGRLLGWRTVCAVEFDAYARSVLIARQNDGCLEPFPIWDDVRTFDGRPWRGIVDVVSGGFPCQDISSAGKGAGIEGEKSGLWTEMARIVGEVQPRFVFVENSPALASRGLGTVLGDLAAMGFDAEWGVIGAHHAGAPHKRDRIWIVARHADCNSEPVESGDAEVARLSGLDAADAERVELRNEPGRQRGPHGSGSPIAANDGEQEPVADADRAQREGNERAERIESQHADDCGTGWWQSEPDVGRVAHGVASRVDRLKCIGNGQVPAVAAIAWSILSERLRDD